MNPDTAPVALPPSYMVHLQPTDSHGHMLAGVYFSGAILSGVAIVVQMYMVASVLSVFFGTPKDVRRARLLVVLTSVAILVTSTTDTLFDIFSAFRILFHGGPDGKSYIAAFANDFVANKHLYLSSDAVSVVTIAIGDLLMLWRCFILWNDSKWIVALPCLAGFGSIVTQIAYLIPPLKGGEAVLAASLSVAMNIMITFLILLKLGLTWRRASQAFPDQKRPPMYGNVAAIIIESATPLAFFGIAYITVIAVYVWHAPQNFTVEILRRMFGWLYHTFCALSPQMIIFRVTAATSRSQTDSEESSVQVHDKMGLFSQPIRFTHTAASDRSDELASTEGTDPGAQSKWV